MFISHMRFIYTPNSNPHVSVNIPRTLDTFPISAL